MGDLPLELVLSATALLLAALTLALGIVVWSRLGKLPIGIGTTLEGKHLAMVRDSNASLNALGDRLSQIQATSMEQLRNTLTQELTQTRSTVGALQVKQVEEL